MKTITVTFKEHHGWRYHIWGWSIKYGRRTVKRDNFDSRLPTRREAVDAAKGYLREHTLVTGTERDIW